MDVNTAVPPRALTNELKNRLREHYRLWPMKMPEGVRMTLQVLIDHSRAVNHENPTGEGACRVARMTPKLIAERTDASVRTVGRRLRWLEVNGFVTVLKAPARGNGATGQWRMEFVNPDQVDAFVDPPEWSQERARLKSLPKKTSGGPAATNGGSAVSKRRSRSLDTAEPPLITAEPSLPTRLNTQFSQATQSSPAVSSLRSEPAPGSSGPRPGPPALVADEVLGDPHGPDPEQQPQDAHASDARAGAPETDEEWMQRMNELRKRMRGVPSQQAG